MKDLKTSRVLWLINHVTARQFEIAMLKKIGFREIFQPKSYPNSPVARSGSVDYSEDANLTIPPDDLRTLNQTDWYGTPGRESWDTANRHFDVLISNFMGEGQVDGILRNFKGAVLCRAYGTQNQLTYTRLLMQTTENRGERLVSSLGERFWFAEAYQGLHLKEAEFLKKRNLYLPLGMGDCRLRDDWTGEEKKIFFVCPDIGCNSYYRDIFRQFTGDFAGFDFAVGGSQPIKTTDPRILGFLPAEEHAANMRRMRVMYYHSREPDHVHYHPFEAVRAGMPLVFMAGGLLDRLGGKGLPGRCESVPEARSKIRRILGDDRSLIGKIRETQVKLLEAMKPENCEKHWADAFQTILGGLEESKLSAPAPESVRRKTRVAVLLPVGFRGGSLAGAKLAARAIEAGGLSAGDPMEVVLGHLDDPGLYSPEDFSDLPPSIKTRPYHWRLLGREEGARAMAYRGLKPVWEFDSYQVPEDGIQQFMDCDIWLVVSDRLECPLLPVHDYSLLLYDYLERYQHLWSDEMTGKFLMAAHGARKVFVTTEFTRQDALQFAGLAESKVVKLPMIAPLLPARRAPALPVPEKPYFVWTTNLSSQKNQENALKALRLYYENHEGRLDCYVTGFGTQYLMKRPEKHLLGLPTILASSPRLKAGLRLLGELPENNYRDILAGSEFLWHAGLIDNGTYSVVEAAYQGVPSLSSDYPAMREIDALTGLGLSWMDPHDPAQMALQLKKMEGGAAALRKRLPSAPAFSAHSVGNVAGDYWKAVRNCL